MTAVWIITSIAGLISLIALIAYYAKRQGSKTTQLKISKQAYEQRDKEEKKASDIYKNIDADLPDRIKHNRDKLLDKFGAAAKKAAELSSANSKD